jgi:hypothetical protein
MGSSDHPGPAGIEFANIGEAVREAVRCGRDIASLDIRKGVAPSGGVIIIDDDLETVRELSFKEISKPSGQILDWSRCPPLDAQRPRCLPANPH